MKRRKINKKPSSLKSFLRKESGFFRKNSRKKEVVVTYGLVGRLVMATHRNARSIDRFLFEYTGDPIFNIE